MSLHLPNNFEPQVLVKEDYIARKLAARDVDLDYEAVMSSIDIIKATRGGKWPEADLTKEDDLIDLSWHQREFEFNSSFAFTVMNKDETKCLGCIYFYPPRNEKSDSDVSISWWVTQEMYDKGFYEVLSKDVKEWVETKWPFKEVFWANKQLPKEIFG
ncbi:MAG: GNAT family N-acetyltransferase [Patescibacteria group bacterium]